MSWHELRRLLKQGRTVQVGTAYDVPGHETEFARTPTQRCARKVDDALTAAGDLIETEGGLIPAEGS